MLPLTGESALLARRPGLLLALEGLAVAIWVALAAWMVATREPESALRAIDPAALVVGGSQDTWMGIYFQGQKVGYAVTATAATADGGLLMQNRSAFSLVAFGEIKEVVTAGTALLDADHRLQQFDFFMSSDPVRLAARGEVRPGQVVIEVHQAGEVQTLTLPMAEAPQISLSLSRYMATLGDLHEGQVHEVPYFDPVTLVQDKMVLRVVGTEILPNGDEAYWVERSFGDLTTKVLVTPDGETVREEGALGLSLVRETQEQALTMPVEGDPVDIIALSAVELQGLLAAPRDKTWLELAILNVPPEKIWHQPPQQVVEGDRVRIETPLVEALPQLPRVAEEPELQVWLEGTPFLPVAHREIEEKAADVLGDITDRAEAAETLNTWVYDYLDKAPTVGVPNALEVLHVGQGDCNEHTALYVALARAAGIPARIAAGVVYSERIGNGAFYYHAWPEVYLGGPTGWVPVDPTFGQFPADATHVKIVEGDLDRQIEIMGVMGRLGFRLLGAR